MDRQPNELAARTVGFTPALAGTQPVVQHPLSAKELAKQLSANFDPPTWAEPQAATEVTEEGSAGDVSKEAPSVLNKLQKWGDYRSVGEPVRPTKFIPMKTPMSQEIISNWTLGSGPKHSLTVSGLLESQAAKGRSIGMIIDLANHECLYSDDIPASVEYEHVQLIAKVLPPPEAIKEVARIANEFWTRHPDKYIAIHCAYGFNRTGFVVCAYLIECCGMSVEAARESFAESRPPGVKHEKFINELYLRYGNGRSRPASRRSSSVGSLQGELRREGSAGVGGSAGEAAAECSRDARRILSRSNSRGGISAAVGAAEQHTAAAAATAAAEGDSVGKQEGQVGTPPGDLQPACNLSAEADRLESNGVTVGRSTSLGLAKALCEDFSMFEGTPVRPSPLTVAMAGGSASAFPHAASLSPGDSPVCAVQLAGQQDWGSNGTCPVHRSGAGCPQQEPAAPAADCTCTCELLPPQTYAGTHSTAAQAASNCSNSRSSSPAFGGLVCSSSAAGAGAEAQCHAGGAGRPSGGRALPSGCGSSVSAAAAGHTLPPLPYSTPTGAGCVPHKPTSPTSNAGALFDSGGGLGLSRTSRGAQAAGTSRFIRSMSAESDNPSLGFGMRQAIMTLRAQNGSPAPGEDRPLKLLELFNSDAGSTRDGMAEYEDLEPPNWDEKHSSMGTSRVGSHTDLAAAHAHEIGSHTAAAVAAAAAAAAGPGVGYGAERQHGAPHAPSGSGSSQQQAPGQRWHPQVAGRGREKPRQAGSANSKCRVM